MGKTALLIIDMQNDFVLEGAPCRIAGALGIVENIKKILEKFRKDGLPVFFIMKVHKKDGSDIEITREERFKKQPYVVEGTEGAEIIDALAPKKGEVALKKIRMDAFLQTDLDLRLRSLGITDVVIIGIQTANCVRATAYAAVAYNYRTCLVDDAVAANTEEIHRANIFDMQNIGIVMLRTREALQRNW